MPIELLALVGSGGHAKVVYDAIRKGNLASRVEVRDDDPLRVGTQFLDVRITGPVEPVQGLPDHVHIAIGDNAARAQLAGRLSALGKRLVAVVHPAAIVSSRAQIGAGAFVAAAALVAPDAAVEECAIINHGCVVDHDCAVGRFAHVAPNATLGGGVRIGEGALVGAAAVVLPGVSVGAWAVIGAGAVVTRAVPDGQTVTGVPATRKPDV